MSGNTDWHEPLTPIARLAMATFWTAPPDVEERLMQRAVQTGFTGAPGISPIGRLLECTVLAQGSGEPTVADVDAIRGDALDPDMAALVEGCVRCVQAVGAIQVAAAQHATDTERLGLEATRVLQRFRLSWGQLLKPVCHPWGIETRQGLLPDIYRLRNFASAAELARVLVLAASAMPLADSNTIWSDEDRGWVTQLADRVRTEAERAG